MLRPRRDAAVFCRGRSCPTLLSLPPSARVHAVRLPAGEKYCGAAQPSAEDKQGFLCSADGMALLSFFVRWGLFFVT